VSFPKIENHGPRTNIQPEPAKRSLITEVGNLIADLEAGLGVTEVTEQLDALLGGGLTKVNPLLPLCPFSDILTPFSLRMPSA